MSGVTDLLINSGAGSGIDIIGEWKTWFGGPGDFWVWGDLGGGIIHLEAALLESAPLSVCGTSIDTITTTKSAVTKFYFNHGTKIRAVVTGTTSQSSGIYAKVN